MSGTGVSRLPRSTANPKDKASPRQLWSLLWSASRPISLTVVAWVAANALTPAAVVASLGVVVGEVPGAVKGGILSEAGEGLIVSLIVAALIYGFSLILDPIGTALGTAAKSRITARLQSRLLVAVSGPVGIDHLEDPLVLDKLSRAEGSLTGYFPGDAPVTWAGSLASRIAGVVGCVVISLYIWWLGQLLLVMWLLVRRFMLGGIVKQATEMRGQTATLRRAWYLAGVGIKARDAKEVRVFGLPNFITERFRSSYTETIHAGSENLQGIHRRAAIGFTVVLASYGLALSAIAVDAVTHTIDLRTMAILLPMLTVTMSAGSVSFDDITLTWSLSAIPDLGSLERDLAPRAELGGLVVLSDRPERSVTLEDVRFSYPATAVEVLSGVDLELEVGTSTAIVGVNGAGKSTLISLLSRLHDPSAGRILVDGIDVKSIDPVEWQRTIAVMPQSPARFPVSAYDNIAYGSIEDRDDGAGVEEVARLSGFAEVVETLPDGWNTVLARELPGGVDLSGGQWQRLALARALFATRHGARLLVLDEPTAALDVRSEARFYERFLSITAGITTVVISHRFATVRRADCICVLDGGRITERGSHDELVESGGTYARMYEVQAKQFGAKR
jgi:ATP-binding cassette subfamily B protein